MTDTKLIDIVVNGKRRTFTQAVQRQENRHTGLNTIIPMVDSRGQPVFAEPGGGRITLADLGLLA